MEKPLEKIKVSDSNQVRNLSQLTLIGVKDFLMLCYCAYREFKESEHETCTSVKQDYNALASNVKYFKDLNLQMINQNSKFTNSQFVIGFRNIVDVNSFTDDILKRLKNRKIKDENWVKKFNAAKPSEGK